ncbi:hypothetical protein NBRC111894_1998 [Sporolactobacillus inulinus]|uniref:Uncharacterized protein n=1 Tax=Sporolactobacillus inulinus TaxID=2078 RepID=A0A4Y1ZBR2_9BACL|nr:hypothetical protein NBRC111894_1998 [Sporolactobacillus inulinus]
MIGTLENISLLDEADELAAMMIQSEPYVNYLESKRNVERDQEAQELVHAF